MLLPLGIAFRLGIAVLMGLWGFALAMGPASSSCSAPSVTTSRSSPGLSRKYEDLVIRPQYPATAHPQLWNRSRHPRRTALAYVQDGQAYVLTASNAGADRHPSWYLNLTADPAVTLQVGTETFPATARPASPAERERLWPVIVAQMPSYAAYRDATRWEGGDGVGLVD
ncbi:nitroreductase/quinone reductase family protein [Streptomyces triculaminicus]|uniref:nitroreductase/quinone reductase family protein n=1 Tax=Streptomyces triculaminicus TaxID=2816232 RepID=UPI0037CE33CA